jgi:MFS family permease
MMVLLKNNAKDTSRCRNSGYYHSVEIYLIAATAIVLLNLIPAFAPPTWMALVLFLLNYDLNPIALIGIGVLAATTGRGLLAWYFRKFADRIPTRFSRNMEYAGQYLEGHRQSRFALLALFFISPLSSAQLFEAAGMMKVIALKPLLLVFAAGRTISYSTYVSGATVLAATNFGELLLAELKSPWAITAQIVMIAGLIGLGFIDWKAKLSRHRN